MAKVDVDVVLRARRTIERQGIFFAGRFAQGVQLITKLCQQGGKVLRVGRGGKFPIDIETVKQTGSRDAGGNVATDKHIDAGSGKGLASRSAAGGGDEGCSIGSRRPSQRHQHFQVGVQCLELLDSRKISVERPRVGSAVHAGQVGRLIIGPCIGKGAGRRRSRCYVAKGVEQVRQFIGHTILLQIRNVVARVVDTPLFEVATENFALIVILCE